VVAGGGGAASCAAASGYLAGRTGAPRTSVWINAGIAGQPNLPRGALAVVSRSIEQSSGRTRFPPLPIRCPLPFADCVTVDKVETDFADDALYDMECAAFLDTAARFSCLELVHAFKVVSDNRAQDPFDLDRKQIAVLIGRALPEAIDALVEPLIALSAELAAECAEIDVSGFHDRWHFSVSNDNRLRALVSDWQAVHDGAIPDPNEYADCRAAPDVLARLRRALDAGGPAE
ncbi:MAG: hypothetical protein DWQ08_05260, partial [Proteobacteria bacterium]